MAIDMIHELVIRGTMPDCGCEGRMNFSARLQYPGYGKVSPTGRKLHYQAFMHFNPISGVLVRLPSRLLHNVGLAVTLVVEC